MSYHILHSVLLLILSILAILAVVLRFWARRIKKLSLELDDYLVMVGLIFALAESAMYIYASFSPWVKGRERLGYEAGPSSPKYDVLRFTERPKLGFISPILWAIAVALIRSSVVTLYIRIFRIQPFRLVCYGVLILNVQVSIAAILAQSLICTPIECRFNYKIPCRSCGDYALLGFFAGISNILLDIIMVILPIPMLWGLQMAVSKKLMLSGMFALGLAICAITAYRLQVTSTFGTHHDDRAVNAYATVLLLTCLEAILGVITTCLPVLQPIVSKTRDLTEKYRGSRVMRKSRESGTDGT